MGDVSDYEMVHYSDHHSFGMVRTIVIALAQPFEIKDILASILYQLNSNLQNVRVFNGLFSDPQCYVCHSNRSYHLKTGLLFVRYSIPIQVTVKSHYQVVVEKLNFLSHQLYKPPFSNIIQPLQVFLCTFIEFFGIFVSLFSHIQSFLFSLKYIIC